MSDIESIRRRYDKAKTIALNFRGIYERAYELVAPQKNNFEWGPGQNKAPDVYDSSGALAAQSFVNTFMNTVTPVHSRWVDLKAGIGIPYLAAQLQGNQNPTKEDLDYLENEINESLHNVTEDLFSYLNASNLYSELGSAYYDAAIGTMVLLCMPGDVNKGTGSPIRFKAISPNDFLLEEGAFGEISGVFRDIKAKARDVLIEWKDIKGLEYEDPEDEVGLIESTIYDDDLNLWRYSLIQKEKFVVQRIYETNPYIVFRYSVLPGEVFGRGPVLNGLPDLLLLNLVEEWSLKAFQISGVGAHTVLADDIVNPDQVRIFPGALIPVKRNAGPSGPTLKALEGIGNPNHQLMVKNDLQAKIKRFLFDESLPGTAEPRMTATEVLERVRKIQRDFGAVFGRISYELIQPIIRRSMDVLIKQNLLQVPKIFSKIDSYNIKMQIISPVARAQNLQDVEGVIQVLQVLGGISPELLMQQVKVDELGMWFANKFGAPLKFFRTPEEQEELRMQAQQAQQAQAMMLQQAQEQAQSG